MRLSRDQRARLLAGDYRPLFCEVKPFGCEPGAVYVLSWSRASRTRADEVVIQLPRLPTRYLVVKSARRHRKGGWLVRFDVHDTRDKVRYLRRTPPVWDPHEDEKKRRSELASRSVAPVLVRNCGRCGATHWLEDGCEREVAV